MNESRESLGPLFVRCPVCNVEVGKDSGPHRLFGNPPIACDNYPTRTVVEAIIEKARVTFHVAI